LFQTSGFFIPLMRPLMSFWLANWRASSPGFALSLTVLKLALDNLVTRGVILSAVLKEINGT